MLCLCKLDWAALVTDPSHANSKFDSHIFPPAFNILYKEREVLSCSSSCVSYAQATPLWILKQFGLNWLLFVFYLQFMLNFLHLFRFLIFSWLLSVFFLMNILSLELLRFPLAGILECLILTWHKTHGENEHSLKMSGH